MPRAVAAGLPHHVTQRGNGRRDVFLSDRLRQIYLNLLREHATQNAHGRFAQYCDLNVGNLARSYRSFIKLVDTESRIADNSRHRKCIYRIMTRDGGDAVSIRHDNMFCSLAGNAKSSLLQGLDCAEMRNAR